VDAVFSVGENAYLCVSKIVQCGLNMENIRFRSVMLSVVTLRTTSRDNITPCPDSLPILWNIGEVQQH
jgi:hypothetical protein